MAKVWCFSSSDKKTLSNSSVETRTKTEAEKKVEPILHHRDGDC